MLRRIEEGTPGARRWLALYRNMVRSPRYEPIMDARRARRARGGGWRFTVTWCATRGTSRPWTRQLRCRDLRPNHTPVSDASTNRPRRTTPTARSDRCRGLLNARPLQISKRRLYASAISKHSSTSARSLDASCAAAAAASSNTTGSST